MTSRIHDVARATSFGALVVWLGTSLPPTLQDAQAQSWTTATGQAYVLSAGGERSVVATLPSGGGQASDELLSTSLAGATTGLATAVAAGGADGGAANAQSIASAAEVSILNGLIRAARVIAIASSYGANGAAGSDANGSVISGLEIGGAPYGGDDATVAPNTRVSLPGVGYVILNEQLPAGGGAEAGITVNAIHVVLTNALGTQMGDIIVASASSAVSR